MNVARSLVGSLVFAGLAGVSASAQIPDPCDGPLIPYSYGNPDLVKSCTDKRPYVPIAPSNGCVKPYPDADVLLCEPGAPAALAETRQALRPLREFSLRANIPQAALGQPGRELTYVNLHNLEDASQDVVVEYAVQGRPGVIIHTYTLAPKTTTGVGLHADPLFTGRLNISVTAYFSDSGSMDMTWLRAADFAETASKASTLIPRAP